MKNKIILSIVMLTYNHEKYIEEALDSIINQNVNYKYEVIIGDDCSKDKTVMLLKQYEERYTDIFSIIYRKKNIGATNNLFDLLQYIKGKYVVFLEGDDFWIDPNKLNIQIRFLEKNENYIAVSHGCVFVDENSKNLNEFKKNGNYWNKSIYTITEFENNYLPGQTTTLMMRNIFAEKNEDYSIYYKAHHLVGDRTTVMLLIMKGEIYCLKKVMSAYRYICKKNGTNARSVAVQKNNSLEMWNYYTKLEQYTKLKQEKEISFKTLKSTIFFSASIIMIKAFNIKNISIFLNIFKSSENKKDLVIFVLEKCIKKIRSRGSNE